MKLATLIVLCALCAAAQAQSQAPQPAAAQAAKAAISGKVVNALSGDPLRKTTIMLASAGGRGAQQARSAISDDQGAFSFPALEPGAYRLIAVRVGYVRQAYGDRDAALYQMGGSILSLKPGQEMNDILFRLQPAAAISGRVVDQDGDPVMHVGVMALRWSYLRGRRQLVPAGSGRTDDRGEYRIFDLTPGRYYLSATYEGGYAAGYMAGIGADVTDQAWVPVFYPGVNDPSQAAAVAIRGGDDVPGINFMLAPQHAVAVSGRVFNALTGQAGRNVHVTLMARSFTMRAYISGDHDAQTDEQGMFRFRGIPPGAYIVTADWDGEGQGPGTVITDSGGARVTQYNRRHYSGRQMIDVGGADLEGLSLVIAPGTDVAGTVKVEGTLPARTATSPETTDTVVMGRQVMGGRMASPMRVMLESLDDVSLGNVAATVQPDNTFVLSNVPDGSYRVTLAGTPGGAYLKTARLGGQDVLEEGVAITRGRRGALDLVISTLTGNLEGAALDSSGKPYAGARVVLVPEGARRKLPNLYRTATSDELGRFALRSVPPGAYKLFAWDTVEAGAYQDAEFLRPFEDFGQAVQVTENGRHTAELKVIVTEEHGAQ